MAQRTSPPFRADHVGSLLRPPELLEARAGHAAGRVSDDELRAVEDEAIRDAVRVQQEVGLQSATDGELRRSSWHMDFIYQLGGVEKVLDSALVVHFENEQGSVDFTPPSLHVGSPVHLEHTIFGDALPLPAGHGAGRRAAEADDPLAEHGALPRRPRGDRPGRLPRPGRVLDRPHRRLPRRGPAARRARLPLPAARRHEPRLPQRPAPARPRRGDRRRPAAPARGLHPPHQRGALPSGPRAWP